MPLRHCETVSDVFQITESCWLRATQNNPSFIPSFLLFFECVSSLKNALKRRLRSRHTKRMRWFILINLIFYSGQEGLVTSSNSEISSCNSCLQLIYKNIKQGHLQHGVPPKAQSSTPSLPPCLASVHLLQTTKALSSKQIRPFTPQLGGSLTQKCPLKGLACGKPEEAVEQQKVIGGRE